MASPIEDWPQGMLCRADKLVPRSSKLHEMPPCPFRVDSHSAGTMKTLLVALQLLSLELSSLSTCNILEPGALWNTFWELPPHPPQLFSKESLSGSEAECSEFPLGYSLPFACDVHDVTVDLTLWRSFYFGLEKIG